MHRPAPYTLPVLETPRLILRDISYADARDMYVYASTPYVGPNAGWAPHTSIHETNLIIGMFLDAKKRGEPGVFAIVDKETFQMIGTIELYKITPNFKAELGYALSHHYWGKGLMVEACQAILKWGFETLNLKRIELSLFTHNLQSKRVAEKLGFRYEGLAKKGYLRYDGLIFNKLMYGITDDEYYER